MTAALSNRIMIVEGLSDKKKLERIITDEDLTIVCTNGTLGIERFDEMLEEYDLDYNEVFIFVDEDPPGIALRKQLMQELPHAIHLYTDSEYKEVAETPEHILATILAGKRIRVNPLYLVEGKR
ncbi:toprim domain-containing protein [Virgibacillus sp. W0181]|uniref:toprim domain-containing protein n=1 Tax=Virgibacillus sp. W0181 TaxID=3391581 RepID=UPI003F472E6F